MMAKKKNKNKIVFVQAIGLQQSDMKFLLEKFRIAFENTEYQFILTNIEVKAMGPQDVINAMESLIQKEKKGGS